MSLVAHLEMLTSSILAWISNPRKSSGPFYAKILAKVENRPGTWSGVRIGVFKKESDLKPGISDVLLGEYVYHYPNPHRTFHPFNSGATGTLCTPATTRLLA